MKKNLPYYIYMDINAISNIISSIGFPIAMCIILLVYIKYVFDKHRLERKELTERYALLIEDLTEVVNNNTNMISRLNDKLDIQREYQLKK